MPTVSVCTVTCNRGRFLPLLEQCILRQTYPRELITWTIVDDSDDGSAPFAPQSGTGLKICYVTVASRLLLGAKRNLSHQHCKGDIIVYMDDDDFYPPERISHAVDSLEKTQKLVAGSTSLPILFLPENKLWLAGPYGKNHATANTFAFRRELLQQTRYEDDARLAEEKFFLKNYAIPMVQLDPQKTIICIGHHRNTFEKRQLIQGGKNPRMRRVQFKANEKIMAMLEPYIALHREPSAAGLTVTARQSAWQQMGIRDAYCISLKSNIERQGKMGKKLQALGLTPLFCEAVVPQTLPKVIADTPIFNRPTELACLASHLRLIQHLANHPGPENVFLVLEDDAILRDNFDPVLFADFLPADWDVIQLGTSNPESVQRLLNLGRHQTRFVRWEHSYWGAFAYLLRRQGAQKISQRFRFVSDCLELVAWQRPNRYLADFMPFEVVNTYTSCDPLATFDPRSGSEIGHPEPVVQAANASSALIIRHWQESGQQGTCSPTPVVRRLDQPRISLNSHGRYLLCRPRGGLNDTLVQLGACWRYAEKSGRKLLVDTMKSGLLDYLGTYFVPISAFQDAYQEVAQDDLEMLESAALWPTEIQGRISRYEAVYSEQRRNFIDRETGAPLQLDMMLDYAENVILHEACGGGNYVGIFSLSRLRFSDRVASLIKQSLAKLPEQYLAVHIRNTDLQTDYIPLLERLAPHANGHHVLIATDNEACLDDARRVLIGAFVLTASEITPNGGRPQHDNATIDRFKANLDNLTDLMALSYGQRLFWSAASDGRVSGYSRLADALWRSPQIRDQLLQ